MNNHSQSLSENSDEGTENAVFFSAIEVAESFSEAMNSDLGLHHEHSTAAMLVGECLVMADRPGRWDQIDLPMIYSLLPPLDDPDQLQFSVVLAGMLGWLGLEGHLPVSIVCDYLRMIDSLAPRGAELRAFSAITRKTLHIGLMN